MDHYRRQQKIRAQELNTAPPKKPSSKGRQIALFTDKDVRRDYFQSGQWVEQHVKVKVHLTGYATAYQNTTHRPKTGDREPVEGRVQGSLYSQQKHAIADAVEWIRRNSRYKPRIFVATCPGHIDEPLEGKFIQKLVNNLKKGYGMREYVWVRELTKSGLPHFHFVADVPQFDAVKLSQRWSSYFGKDAKNSIRVGSKPPNRKFYIASSRGAWYLTKYLGKTIGKNSGPLGEHKQPRRKYRTFAISELAGKMSQPQVFTKTLVPQSADDYIKAGYKWRPPQIRYIDYTTGEEFNPHVISWRWTGHGQAYSGFRK